MNRVWLTGAAWGPITFIACWLMGGIVLPGYSPIVDPISRLAAIGADTRTLMNIGFGAFALGVGSSAWPLRHVLGPGAAVSLLFNAAATVGVLATPLDLSPATDALHTVFAGLAYASLSAVGILAAWQVRSRAWLVIGIVTGIALLASTLPLAPGLFQRIGLTTTDVALIATAFSAIKQFLSSRSGPSLRDARG